ncbi:MAG: methyltransferase domain-containing protein [Kiloniellaceae bacterium]
MTACFEVSTCEVCGSGDLVEALDLGKNPLCDDLIPIGSDLHCEAYPIDIVYCRKCGTAHQRYQVPKVQLFPQTYHYRSRFTADVLSGMAALVESVDAQLGGLDGLTVLDVGCNDGSLLDRFAAKGARTIGVEPTGAAADAEGRGHAIIHDFFSEETAKRIIEQHERVDVITFTNVFAHIEDLKGLLAALSILMNEGTVLVIENHYLGAVLDKNQFDTFYHEHPRTYSLNSFIHIAATLNRKVTAVEFPSRYGGNIRVTIGKAAGDPAPATADVMASTLEREVRFLDEFAAMRAFIETWKRDKRSEIERLVHSHGPLMAKAFPGRAAILVSALGLSEAEIECVYEKPGSLKIGHYLPGTRIPIRSDDELFGRLDETKVLLNMAWHIPTEIETYLRDNGYQGRIVHIV